MNGTTIKIMKDGKEVEAEVLSIFTLDKFKKDYILYTFNEKQGENIKILASTLVKVSNEEMSFENIKTDEEWIEVKEIIKKLARED